MAAVAGVLIGLLLVGVSFVAPPDAAAIPAFSRMFGQSCSACHNPFPQLNQAGEEFRLSGYTRFEGGTALPKVPPITAGKLSLPGVVPISLAATLGFDYHRVEERSRETGQTTTTSPNSFNLEEIELLAGAPLNNHLSFFLDFAFAETEFEDRKFTLMGPDVPMLAAVSFNNLFVDDLLNLRVGAYELPVGFSPEHRRISIAPYEIYGATAPKLLGLEGASAGVAGEPFALLESQLLAELYGTAYSERLGISNLYVRYHIGTSNDSNVNADNNESKSIFGRLSVTFMDQTLGFFGLYSPNVLDQSPPAGFPKASSRVTRFGPDVHLRFFDERLTVKLQHLWARDSDPTGVGTPFEFSGGFVEVNYLIRSSIGTFVPLARFDYVLGDRFDNTDAFERQAGGSTQMGRRVRTAAQEPMGGDSGEAGPLRTKPRVFAYTLGLQYLPWENVKLQAEATYRETKEELSREVATVERDRVREWLLALQVRLAF